MTLDPTVVHRTLPGPSVLGPPSSYEAGSSLWYLDRLTRMLSQRLERFDRLESYYRGTQDTQRLASAAYRESGLLLLFPQLSANHSRLIVNAAANRLVILGFRLGGELRADMEAARIWRLNEMDQLSDVAHTECLVKGECPVLVEPDAADPTRPRITPQDPRNVIVYHAPGDRRIRLAALKTWWDEATRKRFYTLYLPDRIERWMDREPGQMDYWRDRLLGMTTPRWEPRVTAAGPVIPNPLGEVPMVVLPNDPRLSGSPEGEHEPAITLQDLYNKTLMDLAATSHAAAFPQRWGTGVDTKREQPIVDAETGLPVVSAPAQVRMSVDEMVTSPNDEAAFGQFSAADLSGYIRALDTIRADEATITFTPYHFLLNMPSSVPPSGESITATEAALVDKVRGHHRDKAGPWRQVMRLAFLIAGDARRATAMRESGEVIWSDPERRTESQHIDALGKMRTMLGVPEEATWELIPATPEQVARWTAMRDAAAAASPTTPGDPPPDDPEPPPTGSPADLPDPVGPVPAGAVAGPSTSNA